MDHDLLASHQLLVRIKPTLVEMEQVASDINFTKILKTSLNKKG